MAQNTEKDRELMEVQVVDWEGHKTLVVDGRGLHRFLDVGKVFGTWISNRIKRYGFLENQDYRVFPQTGKNPNGGRPVKEYQLSLDMAKELAMLERTIRGKEVRRYFIECEKMLISRGKVGGVPTNLIDDLKEKSSQFGGLDEALMV